MTTDTLATTRMSSTSRSIACPPIVHRGRWRASFGMLLLSICLAACAPSESSARAEGKASATAPSAPSAAPATTSATAPVRDEDDWFPGKREVTISEFFAALSTEADALGRSQTLRDEYDALRRKHGLPDDARLYADFLRVRLAFEATRAGGLWGLEWRVTDRLPQSDAIWTQWRALPAPKGAIWPTTTAVAECDELSALFAVVARGIGLSRRSQVGLFWPTSNHTVAVWIVGDAGDGRPVRIVVPTSQIFLDSAQSLGTEAFDPWRQPRIYDYGRRDIALDATLPAPLARHFMAQARRDGARSRGVLQGMRNRREYEQRQAR